MDVFCRESEIKSLVDFKKRNVNFFLVSNKDVKQFLPIDTCVKPLQKHYRDRAAIQAYTNIELILFARQNPFQSNVVWIKKK